MIFIPIITLIADFYLIFNISTVFFGYITAKYWKDKELVIKNLDVFWHFINPFYYSSTGTLIKFELII